MQHYRLATNHPEFSEFLEKEMKQLKITKDQLREACHISPTHFNNIKKGLYNYEVSVYDRILRGFEEFTTPENAQRIYREGVKTLFPKLKE